MAVHNKGMVHDRDSSPVVPAEAIGYVLVRSRRKTLSLIIHPDQQLEVRCPLRCPPAQVEHFVRSKAAWINRQRQAMQQRIAIPAPAAMPDLNLPELTRQRVQALVRAFPGPKPLKVVIRQQKSRWGSCSSRKTISINSRVAALPAPLIEYIVYHELCHLTHMNHGPDFWHLLSSYLPDARQRQKALRQYLLA